MRLLHRYIGLFLILLFIGVSASAQSIPYKMGKKQYDRGNYAVALDYLLYVWDKNSDSVDTAHLGMVVDCYDKLRRYDEELLYREKLYFADPKDLSNLKALAVLTCDIKGFEASRSLFEDYNSGLSQLSASERGAAQSVDIASVESLYSASHREDSRYRVMSIEGNSVADDTAPCYTLDEESLVFSSNRDSSVYVNRKHGFNSATTSNIYLSTLPTSMDLGDVDLYLDKEKRRFHEGAISFVPKGDYAFITMNRMSGSHALKNSDRVMPLTLKHVDLNLDYKKQDLVEASFASEDFSFGHITFDTSGKYVLFVSDMDGGYGGTDIWYSKFDGTNFTTPVNAGPIINSEYDEFTPHLSQDNTLYFSSDRPGGLGGEDIYSSTYETGASVPTFSSPINLGLGVNSQLDDRGLTVSKDGTKGYFSSNRDGGLGCFDIYHMAITPPIVVEEVVVPEVVVPEVKAPKIDEKALAVKEVKQVIIDFDLENIYYDFDKYFLRDESKRRLDHLVEVLNIHVNINIGLTGHTDSRGTDEYNRVLSSNRVEAAYNYLVSMGIDADRLTFEGMGEEELRNHCYNGVDCSPEEHQANRRTEFEVIYVD